MTKKTRLLFYFVLLAFSVVFGGNVSALSGSTYINKAYLEGVYTCWTGHLKSSPVTQNDFPVFATVFPKRIFSDNNDGSVLIPRVLSGIDDNDLGCVNLMAGNGGQFKGLVSLSGITQPTNDSAPSEKTAFMKNIGYSTEKTTSSTGKCASFNFKANSGNRETRSGTLCLTDLTSDEKITSNTEVEIPDDSGGGNFTLQDMITFKKVSGGVEVSYDTYHENCTQTNLGRTCSGYVKEKVSKTFKVSDYTTFDEFMSGTSGIAGQFNKQPPSLCAGYYQLACIDYTLDITKSDSIYNPSTIDESMVQYVVKGKKATAANTAIKYFSGSDDLKDWDSLKYTDAEKVHLYQDYLSKVFEVSFADDSCPSISDSQAALLEDSGYSKVKWTFSGSGAKTCYIKASEKSANKEVVGVKDDGHFGKKMNFGDLTTALEFITLADGEFDDVAEDDSGNGEVERTCMNSGGSDSLGWIICPLLDWMSSASEDIYEQVLEPNLQVEAGYFDQSVTRDAWSTFQTIANIIFTILVLVVVFSQLTGVGIDNYGIKKILPRLIVAAILINLSYLICILCVDISNILGNSLHEMFDGFITGGSVVIENGEGITNTNVDFGGAITALSILSAIVGAYAVYSNPALLLTLLISALGVLIAVLFLFVLLAGRKAAIVVLTVLSPVAFILYMLPNTKKIFDRWLKLWEAMLLLYPICGLLIGGGNYISRLLLTIGAGTSTFEAFTAMAIGILPIFFIPTLLKSAFAALGSMGSTIAGFGNRMRGGFNRNARNSAAYKNAQERGTERRTRIKAGLDKNGDEKDLNGFRRFIRGGRRGMGRARAQYLKDQDTRARADRLTGVGYEAARIAQTKAGESDELRDYMTLINDRTRNGEDETALFGMYDNYMTSGNKAGALAVARIAGRRKDTAARFMSEKVTGSGLESEQQRKALAERNNANSGIFSSVAKEISTGENSKNYMESAPLGFEFAAQTNRGNVGDADYSSWLGETKTDDKGNESYGNVHNAMNNYVTDSKQLVGMKSSSLRELINLAKSGKMDEGDITRISNLAKETIANRGTTGVWDSTKENEITEIANLRGGVTAPKAAEEGRTFEVPRENRPAGNTGNKNDVQVNPGEGDDQGTWD